MPSSGVPPKNPVLSEAKLAPPRAREVLIPRPRLFAEFDRMADAELTLVSAPVGSGKTVAIASWLDERPDLPVASVTLEESDDDSVRLWTAVATAVDRLCPGIARLAQARLRAPGREIKPAIGELLNGLAGLGTRGSSSSWMTSTRSRASGVSDCSATP
jgi:LuxR family transcriptional regulator, maltose regulon positive regulatory protein